MLRKSVGVVGFILAFLFLSSALKLWVTLVFSSLIKVLILIIPSTYIGGIFYDELVNH